MSSLTVCFCLHLPTLRIGQTYRFVATSRPPLYLISQQSRSLALSRAVFVEGGGFEPPAHLRFLKHQPFGWVWFIRRLPQRFCFFLPYSGAGGLEPPLIQGLRRLPLNVGTLQRLLIPIWLHHLPAFCPLSRAPHGGRDKTNV